MRSYWSRGTSSLEEILDDADRGQGPRRGAGRHRDPRRGDGLAGAGVRRARATSTSARREVAALLETAEQTAQPFMLHVAEHYGSAIALCDGRLDEAEATAQRSHEWSRLLTGRDASGVYGIQMFSIRREQGRLAELAPVIRILAGDAGARAGRGGPGSSRVLAELGMEDEARRELARVADEGLDAFRESLWLASLTYLTDACAALGDEATAALVYPELEPLAGGERDDRPPGRLLRRRRSLPRHARRDARRMGARRGALRARDGAEPAHGSRDVARPHRLRVRAPAARARAGRARPRRARCSARRPRSPSGSACRRCSAASARSGPPRRPPRSPTGCRRARSQILGLVARGLSNREIGATLFISEHTAANHIRSILRKTGCANRTEAASYAHRHGLVEA